MTNIGIVSGNEASHTKNILSKLYDNANRSASIHCLGKDKRLDRDKFKMLIVNEDNESLPEYIADLEPGGIVIANGDDKGIGHHLKGVKLCLITYGFNQKASVTASSVTQEEVQCCVQRLFLTFSGKVLEPQEFPVGIQDGHKKIYNILGAVTAALIDDVYCPWLLF